MTDAYEDEIRQAESRLRAAMLASDVEALDRLIDDRLVFVGPDTRLYTKQDDLTLHRSGAERISTLDIDDLNVAIHGDAAVTTVVARMSGTMHGAPFDGHFRYVRTWIKSPDGWRIIAGCVSPITA